MTRRRPAPDAPVHPTHPAIVAYAALRTRGLLHLLDDVCQRRGVSSVDVCGPDRHQSVARARHELWWRLRHLPDHDYSTCEIARMFGRDSTSVRHGIAAHARRRALSAAPSRSVP